MAMALTVPQRWTSIGWPRCARHARPTQLPRSSSSGASKTWRRAILAGAASVVATGTGLTWMMNDDDGFLEFLAIHGSPVLI